MREEVLFRAFVSCHAIEGEGVNLEQELRESGRLGEMDLSQPFADHPFDYFHLGGNYLDDFGAHGGERTQLFWH